MRVPRARGRGGEQGLGGAWGGPGGTRQEPSAMELICRGLPPVDHPSVHSSEKQACKAEEVPSPRLPSGTPGKPRALLWPSPGAASLKFLSPGLPAH